MGDGFNSYFFFTDSRALTILYSIYSASWVHSASCLLVIADAASGAWRLSLV